MSELLKTLQARLVDAPDGSYTKKLYTDSSLLVSKLVEEAIELGDVRSNNAMLYSSYSSQYIL